MSFLYKHRSVKLDRNYPKEQTKYKKTPSETNTSTASEIMHTTIQVNLSSASVSINQLPIAVWAMDNGHTRPF